MILFKSRRKIKKWALDNYRFYKSLFITQFLPEGQKKVFIEIEEVALNRYLYNFIKFFTLSDYTVYIPENKKVISTLNRKGGEFVYASWILKEQVKIGKPVKADLIITREQLSNDYFGKAAENAYHVPMSEYPGIYRNKFHHDIPESDENRKRSVFMSGNMDVAHYNRISKAGFFEIPSRREVAEFIQKQSYCLDIQNHEGLKDFMNGQIDNKLIVIDASKYFRIPLEDLKDLLHGFDFYLALPGILIPQSHNLIEAMSVGCIPVIHKTYADLMYPPLTHMENALVYDSFQKLNELILESFKIEEELIKVLHENVINYFSKHLTPAAVVKNIEEKDFSKIYIQAEHISLNLLES